MLLLTSSGNAYVHAVSMYSCTYVRTYVHSVWSFIPSPFSYFSQTVHLMKEDSTLYCISAWNDQVGGLSHDLSHDQLRDW